MFERRYMEGIRHELRLVAWVFEPVEPITAAELNDDTVGEVSLVTRAEPGDVWDPPKPMGRAVYDVYRAKVEADGFTEVEIVQTTGEDFAESEAQVEAINASLGRESERVARAIKLARARFDSADVEFDERPDVISRDAGYWVACRVWVDADDVEEPELEEASA